MRFSYPVSIVLLLTWIFSTFILIVAVSSIRIHDQLYFDYDSFKREKKYVDTLQSLGSSKGGTYLSYIGLSKKDNLKIIHFRNNQKTIEELEPLFNEYEKNDKYLNIWISPNSKDAYFDTPALNNTTQLQLWYQPLTEIFIFILMTFILVRWSKYFKKEYTS
jgi:hypothetical protein